MYALKARDKLHKREKEGLKGKERESQQRTRDSDAHHHHEPARRIPSTAKREAKYIGTFSVEMKPGWKSDIGKAVKHQLSRVNIKDPSGCQLPVCVMVNMEGVKVLSADGRDLIMAHALKRIIFCTVDTKKCLFALVARNPDTGSDRLYSNVFVTTKKEQASELNDLVSKAFKANFAKLSLKRDKKKGKKSPWSVHSNQQPQQSHDHLSPQQPQNTKQNSKSPSVSPSSQHRLSGSHSPSAPSHPSHPPPSHSPHFSHPQPLHSPQVAHSQPSHTPPSTPSLSQLLDEASSLEGETAQLQARNREIEGQMFELAAIEDAVAQLTTQLSSNQNKLDEKRRRLHEIQQLIDASLASSSTGGSSHLQPPVGVMPYAGTPVGFSGSGARRNNDLLPDFAALSLEDVDWFQEGLPREIAMEILSHQPEGAFIVRNSSSNPGCYALSLKTQHGKILHYLIENDSTGVRLQGSTLPFSNLIELIHHYSLTCDGSLPRTLNLSCTNPAFLEGDKRGVASDHPGNDSDAEDDDDYLGVPQYRLIS